MNSIFARQFLPGWMKGLKAAALLLLGVSTLAFISLSLIKAFQILENLSPSDGLLVLPATLLMMLAVVTSAISWAFMLRNLAGARFSFVSAVGLFLGTWPTRYVPGTLPYHATRIVFASRMGIVKARTTSSIAYEALLQLCAAATVGATCLLLVAGSQGGTGPIWLILLGFLGCIPVLLRRQILCPVANRVLSIARRQPLADDSLLEDPTVCLAFLGYVAMHALNGLAFFLLLLLVDPSGSSPFLAIAAFSLGGAAGVIVIFVPSGIGVREGVIVAVLASSVEPETAILAAGLARGVSVVADLLPLAVLLVFRVAGRSTYLPKMSDQGAASEVSL